MKGMRAYRIQAIALVVLAFLPSSLLGQEVVGHKPFLVLADYLTRRGIVVLRYDDRGTGRSTGSFETATSAMDMASATAALTRHYESIRPVLESMLPDGVEVDAFIEQQVASMLRPWSRFFLSYDPAIDLERVDVPVLSLNGSTDVQVLAGINQRAIRQALQQGGNTHFVIRELPGLNHMFQQSETGALADYPRIEQTFSPVAMNEIATWVLDQAN